MARFTKIYYVKYSGEDVEGQKEARLYLPNGKELKDHELDVDADDGVIFVFTVPSDGPELTLRFNKAGDPASTPRQPISWTGAPEPAWITLYNPIDPPYKTLSMIVENMIPTLERKASFNLNLYDPASSTYFCLHIHGEGMTIDPTIVEKAPDPPHG